MDSTLPYSLHRVKPLLSFNPPLHFKRLLLLLFRSLEGYPPVAVGVGGTQGAPSESGLPGTEATHVSRRIFLRHHFSRQLFLGFVHNSVRPLRSFPLLEVLHEAPASRVSPALELGPGNLQKRHPASGAEEGNRAQHRDPRSGWNVVYLSALVNLSNLKQYCRLL